MLTESVPKPRSPSPLVKLDGQGKSQSPRHVHRAGKRKAYSTTDANTIGFIEPVGDADLEPAQPAAESGPKLPLAVLLKSDSMGLCSQRYEEIRANTKGQLEKELYARLGQGFGANRKDLRGNR